MVPLDGSTWPVRVSDADFAWDAAWSPDGTTLAWHEWDLPDMPWDASRIAIRHADGSRKTIGGNAVDLKLCKPENAPLGQVPFTDGAPVSAADFDQTFPYLATPLPGAGG